jgi:amidase
VLPVPEDDLCFRSARTLAAAIRDKELSASEVMRAHLDRIEHVNPAVNAVVTLRAKEALDEARAADDLVASGAALGPLHGLPIAHKDTHETAGIRTTYGSPLYAENVPQRDELVVHRLRSAGAISIGKTNVPEFAAGSHTYNEVFGVTRNPYAPDRSAGGSSGGAAAALACGMHPLADGSDMGGSLRNPASFCNVVGLRPTPGRVPTVPSALPWSTLAVQGPMARSVSDVAFMLSVLAGADARSPLSLTDAPSLFAAPLDTDLTGLRVAWTPDLGGTVAVDPEVRDLLTRQVGVFEDLGCVVEQASLDFSGAEYAFRTLRAWQFELAYGELLDQSRASLKPSLVWNIEAGRRLSGPEVARAQALQAALHQRVVDFFDEYDVLLAPVSQVAPFDVELEYPTSIDGQPQETYLDWMRSAYFVSMTGCPALSVPAGFTGDGLPVGLQVIGPPRAELAVLRVGHMYETATGHGRRRPDLTVWAGSATGTSAG